jgi:hypothetical protein
MRDDDEDERETLTRHKGITTIRLVALAKERALQRAAGPKSTAPPGVIIDDADLPESQRAPPPPAQNTAKADSEPQTERRPKRRRADSATLTAPAMPAPAAWPGFLPPEPAPPRPRQDTLPLGEEPPPYRGSMRARHDTLTLVDGRPLTAEEALRLLPATALEHTMVSPAPAVHPPTVPAVRPRLETLPLDETEATRPPIVDAVEEPEMLSLEQYARVKVLVWDGGMALAEALEQCGIDDVAWHAHEQRQTERLAREATEGKGELGRAIRDALQAQRRAHSTEHGALSLSRYALVRAAIEQAADEAAALVDHGLSPADWRSHRDAWERRLRGDRNLQRDYKRALARARRGLRPS